jgi:probable O-glycosylation ligase (exosortase A-associated)
MKQLILMIVMTAFGALGALFNGPFWGLAVYYLFAVLRPQYLWKWTMLLDIQWSLYVAIPTLVATALYAIGFYDDPEEPVRAKKFSAGHLALLGFGAWIWLSYLNAYDPGRSYKVVIEYSKILIMMSVAAFIVRQRWQIWTLVFIAAFSLIYISYEVNYMYLVNGYLGIYHNGYGGLDNNGAGMMIAMAIPMCVFIWEGFRKPWRWFFAAMIPVLLHAVLMTYSRGAMVAVMVTAPLIFLRSRKKGMMTLAFVMVAVVIPFLAGPEIRQRFFSIERYQEDRSAQSRLASWNAGLRIAEDYPIFGIGPRNAPLVIRRYGGDTANRVIHSQYIQIAADLGFVGLAWYLSMLASAWLSLRRVRKRVRKDPSEEARRLYALACAVECSLAVFCTGACFLAVEVFELPYLLMIVSIQLSLALQVSGATEESRAVKPVMTSAPMISPAP